MMAATKFIWGILLVVSCGGALGLAAQEVSPHVLPAIDKKYERIFADLFTRGGVTPPFLTRAKVALAYLQEVGQWLQQANIDFELHDQLDAEPEASSDWRYPRPYILFRPGTSSRINYLAMKAQLKKLELRFDPLKNLISGMPSIGSKTAYRWKMSYSDPEESNSIIFIGSWFLNNPSCQNYLDILNDITLLELRQQNPKSFLFTVFVSPPGDVYPELPWASYLAPVSAALYAIHVQIAYLERALYRISRPIEHNYRVAILDSIDFRYNVVLERAAWHLLNFHKIFAAALRPSATVSTASTDFHRDWFLRISSSSYAPRYKIRLPRAAWIAGLRPTDVFAIKTIQQSYRYLAEAFPKLLAIRPMLENLTARDFYLNRQIRHELQAIVDLPAKIEAENLSAAQFKQELNADLYDRHQQAFEVFAAYQKVKKDLQKIVAAQCAAHLTTPKNILRHY